ncbi:MAG TPA: DUF58 domain-containing protein [Acidimicrobiales bacterium]|nr:DUF58 domain-containing protein [Acidimicrobiales bacterium]
MSSVPTRPGAAPPHLGQASTEELLRRLELAIAGRLEGVLHGNYQGLVPGHGTELGETRAYQPGDDVRRIDWNVTARLQEPYIRETIADRELETWLLIDLSPSLDFGTASCEKRDLAVAAAAAIGFLTHHTGNRIGALLLDPRGVTVVPARAGRGHLMALLHQVADRRRAPEGSTDLADGIGRLGRSANRRGLVVVISDFLAPPTWTRALRAVSSRHEALCVEVIDPRELELPDVGTLDLVDPETGAHREVRTSPDLRRRYADAARAQRERNAHAMREAGADHLVLRTDSDWLHDLVRFVDRRRRHVTGAARR